jgi:hypothetical protein
MSLEDEINLLIDSTALSEDAVWNTLTGKPPIRDETTQSIETLSALLKGHRLALRRLAREIDDIRSSRGDLDA